MRITAYTNLVLTAIAILLGVIAVHPFVTPTPVSAEPPDLPYLYIEPRTTILRRPDGRAQAEGKVVVDLRNGNIWGFPTLEGVPYPVDRLKSDPPVSEPMYLGRFDLSKMQR